MALETAQDRAEMYLSLGETATYTPAVGSASTLYVILSRESVGVAAGGSIQVESMAPVVRCNATDTPSISEGDTFAVGGTTYTVVEVQYDSTRTHITALCRV